MNDFFDTSLFAGVTISLLAYLLGMVLKKKFKLGIFNPLLISICLTIVVLIVANIDYDTYNQGAVFLSWFLTPATVCLAILRAMAAFENQFKGRSPRDYRRRSHKPLHRICTGQDPAPVTQRICNTFAKINHYCDRNGRFRGTWRLCDDHGSCDRRHRSAWKHLR